jgi:hypothetical protein
MWFLAGMFLGAVVMGWVAHKRPQWFARVVAETNSFNDKVNARVSDEVEALKTKVGQ